jgi:hypothetical protein
VKEPGPARLFSRALAVLAGVVLVALLAGPLAYHAFFTGLEDYDDEGYLLISLREYARGGILYDEVYSQYGPAYHQLLTPVFRLGRLAFVPMHGRALGALLLLVTAIVCAVAIWRLTRSVLLTLAGELLVVHALVPSRAEPLHPGALLALLLAGLVVAGTFLETGWRRTAAAGAGILLAIMLLVKVNVGVFAAVSVAGALAAASPAWRGAVGLRRTIVAAMIALPVLLLAPRLGEPTIRAYLAVAFASGLGVALVSLAPSDRRQPVGGRSWPLTLAGAVVLTACLGWELVRGTTLAGLLDGVVLGPVRHPQEFFFEPELGREAFVAGAAGLGAALAFVWARRRGLTESPSGAAVVGAVQVLGGAVLWLGAAHGFPAAPLALMPLVWVALAGRRAEPGSLGPLVLALVAALQTLHAYPVAGTQVAWATFLAVPVGAVALADGWRGLRGALETLGAMGPSSGRLAGAALGAGLVVASVSGVYATHRRFEAAHAEGVPLGLPGAERVRVPAERAALYRGLAGDLTARCRTFVTQPGLFTFHLVTKMDPPTRLNATVWMLLLSDAQQERIVERLAASPAPVCALRRQRRVFTTPLARYIEERFVTLFEVESFEFRIRREPGVPAPA